MTGLKRVLIVDDHPLVREGIKRIVETAPQLLVAGEAGSAAEALRLYKEISPDCMTLDISLPDKSGIQVIEELSRKQPNPAILVVTMCRASDLIVEAFRAGALGYVAKESVAERLIEGLQSVLRGESYLDSSLSINIVEKLLSPTRRNNGHAQGYNLLSIREQEVMRLIAEGLSAKDIAARLFLSSKTVDNHRGNIMKKLQLKSTVEIVRYAARLGLIDMDVWKDS